MSTKAYRLESTEQILISRINKLNVGLIAADGNGRSCHTFNFTDHRCRNKLGIKNLLSHLDTQDSCSLLSDHECSPIQIQ